MDADNKTVVVYHQNGDKGFYSCKIPWTTTVSNLSNNVLTVNVLYYFTYLLFVIIVLRPTIRLFITVYLRSDGSSCSTFIHYVKYLPIRLSFTWRFTSDPHTFTIRFMSQH